MDPWIELAKMGPSALVLGGAVVALWRRLLQKDDEIAALTKEHARQQLETVRLTDKMVSKLYQRAGKSYSPFPSSNP